MYCRICGNKISDDASFCDKCGAPVKIVANGKQRSSSQQRSGIEKEKFAKNVTDMKGRVSSNIDRLELDYAQKIFCIISAIAAISLLINISGSIGSWITAIAGIALFLLCLRKTMYNSIAMAIVYSAFALPALPNVVMVVWSYYYNSYVYIPSKSIFLCQLIMIGMAAVYWIIVLGKMKEKRGLTTCLFAGNVLVILIRFISMFGHFRYGFKTIMYDIGCITFLLTFALMVYFDGRTIPYLFAVLRGDVSSHTKKTTSYPDDLPENIKPISMWGYFGYQILFLIPLVGFIIILVFSFGGTKNTNLKNYARAYLCIYGIALLIVIIVVLALYSYFF